MNKKRSALVGIAVLALPMALVLAQQAAETVAVPESLSSDQYLAGRVVQVTAPVNGDVVMAGQELSVDAKISGDLIAAGETVEVRNAVGDDVRVAGRTVTLSGQVAGHAVAAGEKVVLEAGASVGDWAWLAGQNVSVEGQVGGELRAAGERVVVSGEVGGDAIFAATDIEVESGAVIRGDLIYDSDTEPKIAAEATVEGQIIQEDLAESLGLEEGFGESGGIVGALVFAISVIAAALVAFLVFPAFSGSLATRIRTTPLRTLALGIGAMIGIPLLVILLFATQVGWILALGLLFCFLLLLVCAMVLGIASVGQLGLQVSERGAAIGLPMRLLAIGLGVILVLLLAQIPVLGGIIVFLVLVGGLGAVSGELWHRYRQTTAV